MKNLSFASLGIVMVLCTSSLLYGEGARTQAGLTLLAAHGARSAALAESFTAVSDDIAAFGYNPASLGTLKTGHAAFSFQRGFNDDGFGEFLMGTPTKKGGVGLSVGYYNGGTIQYFDGSRNVSITAQRDLAVGLGWARTMNHLSFGVTGKYFSSELGETNKATALAADMGATYQLRAGTRIGISYQNHGNKLKFNDVGDDLPRVLRTGITQNMNVMGAASQLFIDVPYYLNQSETRPSIGIETHVGPLSFRAGYQKRTNDNELSLGTGFSLGKTSIDYAFGLMNQSNSTHRVSLSMRFAPVSFEILSMPKPVVKPEIKPEIEETPVPEEMLREPVQELPTEEMVEELVEQPGKDSILESPLGPLPENPDAVDAQTKEKIMKWWRNRYRLGDLDKDRGEWNEIYKKYWIQIEESLNKEEQ